MDILDGTGYMDQVSGLIARYARELGRDLSFQGIGDELADPARRYAPPAGGIACAVEGGRAVGMVAYRRLDGSRCEMKRLYVEPGLRGEGTGERLARTAVARARAAGYAEMVLDTVRPLEAALGLYRKLGFEPCPPYYDNPMDDVVYLSLDLSSPGIRPARPDELDAVWDLYGRVAADMEGTPLDVWWRPGLHPTRARLARAARSGDLVAAFPDGAGRPAGAFVLDGEQGADYGRIPWGVDAGEGEVQVVHLLCTAPGCRGRSLGRDLVLDAAARALARGARALRLDAFSNNGPAVALYRSCGFADRGVFDIRVGGGLEHASHLMELRLR